MVMPKSLSKVQKHISKKRGGKGSALHENSRNAQRLRRAGGREDKIAKILKVATRSNDIYVERVAWLKLAIEGSTGPLSEEELHVLTSSFISREDDELEDIKAHKRAGRPPSSREDQIQQQKDTEQREYRAGFWIPDIRDEEGRLKLERWGGSWAGLNNLNFIRIVEGGEIKPSTFPPKGLS